MLVLKPSVSRVRIDELVFSPDGTSLAAPTGGGVMLWTAFVNGAKAERLRTPVERVEHLAFSPDGALLKS
jgi:uncharacterized protein with WD repeat